MTKNKRMSKGIARAFELLREIGDNPDATPENTVVISPDQVAGVFTPERARIYMIVQQRGTIDSVGDLARLLDRDVTRVSRDVNFLEGFGLLRLERDGKSKRVVAERRPVLVA